MAQLTEPIFNYHGTLISGNDVVTALRAIGISTGDEICVHSSLVKLGKILVAPEQMLATLVAALREVVGATGTILMPTFSYSYCHGEVFDVRTTPSTVGILTEYYRQLDGVKRTHNPIFSFAVSGPETDTYLACPNDTCFGPGSVYDVMTQHDAKVVLLGHLLRGHTFIHYVEECAHVSYRFYKTFHGTTIDEAGQAHESDIQYYVRCLDRPSILTNFYDICDGQKTIKQVPLAGGEIATFNCRDYKAAVLQSLHDDESRYLAK